MKFKNLWFIKALFSFLVLAFLLKKTNLNSLQTLWENVSSQTISFAVGLMILQIFVTSLRWQYILNVRKDGDISFLRILQIKAIGLFANNISGALSLFSNIGLIHKEGVSIAKASGSTILDKFFVLFSLVIFSLICLPFMPNKFQIMGFYLGAAVIVGTLFLLVFQKFRHFFFKFLLKISPKIKAHVEEINSLQADKVKDFSYVLLLSFLSHFLYFASICVLAKGMSLGLGLEKIVIFLPVISLISSIPLSLGGWGTREYSFAYFLTSINILYEKAILLSIIVGVLTYVAAFAVFIMTFLQKKARSYQAA